MQVGLFESDTIADSDTRRPMIMAGHSLQRVNAHLLSEVQEKYEEKVETDFHSPLNPD